ncbi:MAG: hemerythrin family protein [Gammaproteobacteria bacterium]|nr:hemerythrin family protein [Gammaproteobacteria bacterium]NIR83471.1 hemerythrin family protein [Gammaproteobacteria bacterium]NIR91393.1 hemerythrin family protein [Gammaproteobacteria bacterium]NIU04633.1 hemerythrin family protein [Gammaproteobacteria bacterium]NIV51675.1 bacteriohemerythrin [Gammaproteobacteria bacterium]
MALIEWKEEFSVGVASVDHEHRELIELINDTHDHLVHTNEREAVADFLGEIYAKISAHFALEERLMREQEYDQYLDHKADHERLLDEIRDIMDYYLDTREFDEERFAAQLASWFTEHFKTKDARLHKYLR